jgi:hypothetical protein
MSLLNRVRSVIKSIIIRQGEIYTLCHFDKRNDKKSCPLWIDYKISPFGQLDALPIRVREYDKH